MIYSSFSWIVPAYNEEKSVRGTVSKLIQASRGVVEKFEIILVNDGSTDKTGDVIRQLAKEEDVVRDFHHDHNRGLGAAIQTGLAKVTCEYFATMPADDTLPVDAFRILVSEIGSTDLVVAYFTNPKVRPWFRRMLSRTYVVLLNFLFGFRLPYYHGAVYRASLVRGVEVRSRSFGLQAELLVKVMKKGCTWKTVGIPMVARESGKSSALKPRNVILVIYSLLLLVKWFYWDSFLVSHLKGPNEQQN